MKFVHIWDVREDGVDHHDDAARPETCHDGKGIHQPREVARCKHETEDHSRDPDDKPDDVAAHFAGAFTERHIERQRDDLRHKQRAVDETDFTAAKQIIFDKVRHDGADRIDGDEGKEIHGKCINERAILERLDERHFPVERFGWFLKLGAFLHGGNSGDERQGKERAEGKRHYDIARMNVIEGFDDLQRNQRGDDGSQR